MDQTVHYKLSAAIVYITNRILIKYPQSIILFYPVRAQPIIQAPRANASEVGAFVILRYSKHIGQA